MKRNGTTGKDTSNLQFHEENISEEIAYLRPVTFDKKEISKTKAAISRYTKSGVSTLILDLRAPIVQVEFARAASFADLFTKPNELLFKIWKPGDEDARLFLSKDPKRWTKRLVILIDRETSSVAETVAAVLRSHCNDCLLVGERTLGKAVQYEEVALNESTALRFASAQVLLPDDTSLFRKGVTPSLRAVTPSQRKKRVFAASLSRGMAPFVYDKERPRMNEAALVAGTNPELDYFVAKSLGEQSPFDRQPLRDRTLQTALESLLTIDYLVLPEEEKPEKPTAPAKKKPSGKEPAPPKETPKDTPSTPEEKDAPEKATNPTKSAGDKN